MGKVKYGPELTSYDNLSYITEATFKRLIYKAALALKLPTHRH